MLQGTVSLSPQHMLGLASGSVFRHPFRSQVPLHRGPVSRSQRQATASPGTLCVGGSFQSHLPLRARRRAVAAAFASSDGDGTVIQPDLEEAQQAAQAATGLTRQQLWFAAVKPPMYTVCIIPVLVAAALAYHQTGVFAFGRYLTLTLASICIIAWLNLSNDAFDAAMGVDAGKPESIVNLTGDRVSVLWAANGFLAAGLAAFVQALLVPGDPRPFQMLGAAIAMGYMYQGPPFRLSYKGLGEPICFVAFGPLSTAAFYLAQAGPAAAQQPVPAAVWAASSLLGVTIACILFCSHFHQIEGDRAAGKISPLVRLGAERGLQVLRGLVALPYLLLAASVATGLLPAACLAAALISLPGAKALLGFAAQHRLVPDAVKPLKKYAIKWHTPFGLAMAAGLIWTRRSSGLL